MSNNWTGTSGNGSGNSKIQSFLEALRNSQTRSSELDPTKNIFSEVETKKSIEKQRIEQFHHQRNQEWNKIFSSKEIETQRKIENLRQELSLLSSRLTRLDKNIVKAVESPIAKADIYQESFLEHIKNVIHRFSLKVESANSWLEIYNGRSKKQGAYWGMAVSKGTSYTQNNERSIATSVG